MSASEQIAKQFANGANVFKIWANLVFNVKECGAKGDGVTDDTVAFQVAINYVKGVGKKDIWIPPGTYKYTTLTNTENITFYGDGVTLIGTTVLEVLSFHELGVRIDNIVASVGNSNSEIVDARLPDDANSPFPTLKDRLDAQYAALGVRITAEETVRAAADTTETNARIAADAAHAANASAHPAQNITYSGQVTGATNVKAAVDAIKAEVNQLIVSGDSGPEAAAARVNASGTTFPTLKVRLDTSDAQLAETAEDVAAIINYGTKASRPITNLYPGRQYFATDLSKRIEYNGYMWQYTDGSPADQVSIIDGNIYSGNSFYTEQTFTSSQSVGEQLGVVPSKDWIYYFKFKFNDADDYMQIEFKESGVRKLQIGFGYDWVGAVKDGSSISVFDEVNGQKIKLYSGNFYSDFVDVVIWYDKKWNYLNFYLNSVLVASWKPGIGGVNVLNQTRIGILVGFTATSATFKYHYIAKPLVTAIGDSITAGAIKHAPNPDHYAGVDDYDNSYPKKLSDHLQTKGIKNYFVVNKGVNGEKTYQMSDRFTTDIVATDCKYVLIHGGINDWTSDPATNVVNAANNKLTMANNARANGIIPIILGVLPTQNAQPYQPYSVELNEHEKSGVYGNEIFINLWNSINDKVNVNAASTAFLDDGVHPNKLGYVQITEAIKPFIT